MFIKNMKIMLSYKPDVFVRKKNINTLLSNINDCNGVGEPEYQEKINDQPQVSDILYYHIKLYEEHIRH